MIKIQQMKRKISVNSTHLSAEWKFECVWAFISLRQKQVINVSPAVAAADYAI